MDEEDDKDDTKRKSRNLSEKKRRDQFNMLVNELSAMVSTNSRKMDKSTVLKSTIAYLRNHNEITVKSRVHDIQEDWKPAFLSNEEFTHLILEALDGFIMVFSSDGQIHYASESVTPLLGHVPCELINTSIYELTYQEDRAHLFNMLQNPVHIDPSHGVILKENQLKFSCHIKRGTLDFRDEATYELVQFTGFFRPGFEGSEEGSYSHDTVNTWVFVCTGRLSIAALLGELSPTGSIDGRNEFTSRHSLEWKFLFLDHRAPPIIGYLPFEVLGTSGYDYYHFDDLDKVIKCHYALMQKGELTSCYYRFLTKGQQWLWLQTRFYITYHQWNSKPEFVVCTHRVVNRSDILKTLQQELNALNKDSKSDSVSNSKCDIRTVLSEDGAQSASTPLTIEELAPQPDSNQASSVALQHQTESPHHHRHLHDMQITRLQRSRSSRQHRRFGPGSDSTTASAVSVLSAMSADSSSNSMESNVSVTTAQAHLQERLQRKHEQLRRLIHHQQEELRRVSHQLVMARYGLLQPEVYMAGAEVMPAMVSAVTAVPTVVAVPAVMPQVMSQIRPAAIQHIGNVSPDYQLPHHNHQQSHQQE